ncbi:MAG: FG-GAP repeat protein, partial [Steroidobacter sp.]
LKFNWAAATAAKSYRLLESPDGVAAFVQVGADLTEAATNTSVPITVHRVKWADARYQLAACNNTDAGDAIGASIDVSADRRTLAVGSTGEASAAGAGESDNTDGIRGAVYVFTHDDNGRWTQQAYLKAANAEAFDNFGRSLAVSADGNTLAVGASGESSGARGVNGDSADNSAQGAGAVYVYVRNGLAWAQQAYLKASNTGASDAFGTAVALSAAGDTLAVSAFAEDGNAIGGEGDNSAESAGAAYVFTRAGTTWSQQAYLKAANADAGDFFGNAIALSANGDVLAVAAFLEDSSETGVGSGGLDNGAPQAGAVYVFVRSGANWSSQAYLKASNTQSGDGFGQAVALDASGNTLAVGAGTEDSGATGADGNQADNSAPNSGAVYVFTRAGAGWSQQAYLKASNTGAEEFFGLALALSADGSTLPVGASNEDSNARGVDGEQGDNTLLTAGAVYLY